MSKEKLLVSIDVFDTAVFRDVFTPKELFLFLENKIGNDFYNIRTSAQVTAGSRNPNYSIIDIYNCMPRKFNPKDEILAEIKGTRANPDILNFYNNNKEVYDFIFISDMYLPSSVLKMILEHAGYKNPVVFVSCEEGCTKWNGKLFRAVEEKLGRKIHRHIGDNYHVDIEGAKKADIPEVDYVGPAIYEKETNIPFLKEPKLRKLLIDNAFNDEISIEEKVGYTFAPLALLFTQTLLNSIPDDKTIFFNARDSFIMYIIARWILKTEKKVKYCRFSRKSVHLPYFKVNYDILDVRNKKSTNFLHTLRASSLDDFLASIKIECTKDLSEFLEKYGITMSTDLSFNPNRRNIFKEFISLMKPEIYERALEQKECLKLYLQRLGMEQGDVFVDLGHYGSMQSILQDMTGIQLQGEYIHLAKSIRDFLNDDAVKHSFLPLSFLMSNVGIVELIFSEPKGTISSYDENGIPEIQKDLRLRNEITKKILRGVFKGVKDILRKEIEVPYEDCIEIIKRFLFSPTVEEAEFANRKLFENGSVVARESIVCYDKDMIKRGKIGECYNRSYWKPAFKVLLENDPDYKHIRSELKF